MDATGTSLAVAQGEQGASLGWFQGKIGGNLQEANGIPWNSGHVGS